MLSSGAEEKISRILQTLLFAFWWGLSQSSKGRLSQGESLLLLRVRISRRLIEQNQKKKKRRRTSLLFQVFHRLTLRQRTRCKKEDLSFLALPWPQKFWKRIPPSAWSSRLRSDRLFLSRTRNRGCTLPLSKDLKRIPSNSKDRSLVQTARLRWRRMAMKTSFNSYTVLYKNGELWELLWSKTKSERTLQALRMLADVVESGTGVEISSCCLTER